MSGRHRKPAASSISMAKIAVTGAVIGGGTIGMAAQAQAASDSEWDTVASCESSGNWAINTGNGYQGGLQFSSSTWLSYGGGQFASAANMATKSQQIAIAEKVLAGQGRGAWPVCGRGLSGPTQRSTTAVSAPTKAPAQAPAIEASAPAAPSSVPTDVPADTPAPGAPQDTFLTETTPAAQDPAAQSGPLSQNAPAPQSPAELAPAPQDAPAQELPAPKSAAPADPSVPAASKPEIISISEEIPATDIAEPTIISASLIGPADQLGVQHLSIPGFIPGPVG